MCTLLVPWWGMCTLLVPWWVWCTLLGTTVGMVHPARYQGGCIACIPWWVYSLHTMVGGYTPASWWVGIPRHHGGYPSLYITSPVPWWPYYSLVYGLPTHPGYTTVHTLHLSVCASASALAEGDGENSLGSVLEESPG